MLMKQGLSLSLVGTIYVRQEGFIVYWHNSTCGARGFRFIWPQKIRWGSWYRSNYKAFVGLTCLISSTAVVIVPDSKMDTQLRKMEILLFNMILVQQIKWRFFEHPFAPVFFHKNLIALLATTFLIAISLIFLETQNVANKWVDVLWYYFLLRNILPLWNFRSLCCHFVRCNRS